MRKAAFGIIVLLVAFLAGCGSAAPTRTSPPPATPAAAVTSTAAGVYGKVAYLTFDDGPNSRFTPQILAILKRSGARATFSVVGEDALKNPDVLREELADGNAIEDHTYSHDIGTIYKSTAAFMDDLNRGNQVIAGITGQKVQIFRAPGGPAELKPAMWAAVRAAGYRSFGWNITSADSDPHGVTPDQIYDNVTKGIERMDRLRRPPVILMHDGWDIGNVTAPPGTPMGNYIVSRESDAAALPRIIRFLKDDGYSFGVLTTTTPARY